MTAGAAGATPSSASARPAGNPRQARSKTPPGAATLAARAARDARDARAAQQAGARARGAGWQRGAVIAVVVLAAGALAAVLWLPRQPASGAADAAAGKAALRPATAATTTNVTTATTTATTPAAASESATPPLSLSELLAGHSSDWRLARLQDNPAVLVIEFPDLRQQGAAMNRIAALLEKADAPRDRVLNDAELAALIERSGDNSQTFYQGHDYDGAGLARFYQLVQRQGLRLNAGEERVRRELLAAGVLTVGMGTGTGAGVQAQGVQALITFTATQPDDPSTTTIDETVDERRRDSILRHEASHGRFYTRPVYREHCRRFWRDVWTETQREKMRRFLASIGYNRQDEDLMLNEAQAFLMNTPDERAINAAALGMTQAELATLRTRFWQTLPADEHAAAKPVATSSAAPGAAPLAPAVPTKPATASRP